MAAATALMGMAFAACAPSNLDKAYDKMAIEGYRVQVEKEKTDYGCLGVIRAEKTETDDAARETDRIVAYLFDSKKAAKTFYDAQKQILDENTAIGSLIRDGKWVYMGTEDAIDDFTD